MGTFPYNEPYNREFWKQTAIWKDPVSETGPDNIDTETVHTIWTGNTSIDYYWPNVPDTSNGGSLSYAFSDVVSNRLSITVKYQLSKECNGNHNDLDQSQVVITLVDGVNEKASGYRPISEMEEGKEYEFTIETTPKETEQLKKNFYIKDTHVTITEISYKELPWEVTESECVGNFSDVFHLYGLSKTIIQPGDFESFRNNALGPDHSYDKEGFSPSDLVSLVGRKNGVMHEEISDDNSCNLMRFREELSPDEGVDYILAEDGSVSLDYFFGSASTFNSFGYFYYSDEEAKLYNNDPDHFEFAKMILKKPKFLLIYRACPGYNIYIKRSEDSGWEEQSKLSNFIDAAGNFDSNNIELTPGEDEGKDKSDDWKHCMEFTTLVDKAEEMGEEKSEYPRLRSANYRLVYFPPEDFEVDESSPTKMVKLKDTAKNGSYIFPKGTHIAFFVINGGQYAFRRNGEAGFKLDHRRISFSRPWLNKYLGNVFNAFGHYHQAGNPSKNIPGPDAQDPWTPFVTYQWAGRTTMGVEDYFARTQDGINGGDHDMNDMIFSVNGNFERDRPDIDPNTPELPSWIVACEDLGGTFDFDFNDVVFGISHVAGETKATITALASGGTLPVHILSRYPTVNKDESEEVTIEGKTLYKLKPTGSNDGEFHSWWGSDHSYTQPINVNSGWTVGKSVDIIVPTTFSMATSTAGNVVDEDGNMGGFRVMVNRDGKEYNIIKAPRMDYTGEDINLPQMFLVERTWKWPVEREHIRNVYLNFFEWKESWWDRRDGPDAGNVIFHKWKPIITPQTK